MFDQNFFIFMALVSFGGLGYRFLRLKREFNSQKETIEALTKSLIQNSKMSVLGSMAGNVAHELNTPLSIIQIRTEQLLSAVNNDETLDREKFKKSLGNIEMTAKRIGDCVSNLRSFVRDSSECEMVEYPVSAIVEHAIALSREKFKYKNMELEYSQENEVLLTCRPPEITQAILYLLLRADSALSDFEPSEKGHVKIELKASLVEVQICVTDNRKEGAVAKLEHLNVVSALVESYGGTVKCGMQSGQITLCLPRVPAQKVILLKVS